MHLDQAHEKAISQEGDKRIIRLLSCRNHRILFDDWDENGFDPKSMQKCITMDYTVERKCILKMDND